MQKHRKVWQPLHWTDSHDKIRDLALNSKYTKQNYGRNNASTFYRGKHGSINLLCTYTAFLGISWMVGMQARLTYCTLFLPRHTPTHLVALMFMNHIFSCDQAALRTLLSVRLFVRPSVTPFSKCSPHCIIIILSGVIAIDKSGVHAKGQVQWSKVKVTEVKNPFIRFRTVTPVWIHIWRWNDAKSFMLLRRGAVLFFKAIRQISRSHSAKLFDFDQNWAFPDCNSSLN